MGWFLKMFDFLKLRNTATTTFTKLLKFRKGNCLKTINHF